MTVKQAYEIAKTKADPHLIKILDFDTDFGFLFSKEPSGLMFGGYYILVDKQTKIITILPTIPNNLDTINSGKNVPLTMVK